uniref:Uncharacterized protein n=1 Tax=Caenorhabditis japonica TaxID=281687 RepID=A0A8R1ELM5_CAEJA
TGEVSEPCVPLPVPLPADQVDQEIDVISVPTKVVDVAINSEPSLSTPVRPRRNARKSVLYNNSEYELQMPGVPKEEEIEGAIKRAGRVSEGVVARGAKKRKAAPHLEEMEHDQVFI